MSAFDFNFWDPKDVRAKHLPCHFATKGYFDMKAGICWYLSTLKPCGNMGLPVFFRASTGFRSFTHRFSECSLRFLQLYRSYQCILHAP